MLDIKDATSVVNCFSSRSDEPCHGRHHHHPCHEAVMLSSKQLSKESRFTLNDSELSMFACVFKALVPASWSVLPKTRATKSPGNYLMIHLNSLNKFSSSVALDTVQVSTGHIWLRNSSVGHRGEARLNICQMNEHSLRLTCWFHVI